MIESDLTSKPDAPAFIEAQQLDESLRSITPEAQQETKVISFVDKQGVERQPYPETPECYASPEIQEEVNRHFVEVAHQAESMEAQLTMLESPEPGLETSFNPLSHDLLEELKIAIKQQLPGLTRTEQVTVTDQITEGRIFKKTKEVRRTEVRVVPVEGFVKAAQDPDRVKAWQSVRYAVSAQGDYLRSHEQIEALSRDAASRLKELLTGDERKVSDPSGQRLWAVILLLRSTMTKQRWLD